jgi:hypothetical protein
MQPVTSVHIFFIFSSYSIAGVANIFFNSIVFENNHLVLQDNATVKKI